MFSEGNNPGGEQEKIKKPFKPYQKPSFLADDYDHLS
jgi:hypothetical protein